MKIGTVGTWIAIIGGAFVIVGGAYAALDRAGLRPVVSSELDEVRDQIEVVGQSVEWLRFYNFHNRLKNGGSLSPKECAEYNSLAKRLGARARLC